MTPIEIVGSVIMITGAALTFIAALGIHRFPDVFARMHAASKPATLGLVLVFAGGALVLGGADNVAKLVLLAAFQFLTIPIAAHMIARAAHSTGRDISSATVVDQLAQPDDDPT